MIEKKENDIIDNGACDETVVDKEAIEQYLSEVRSAVRNDRYRIDRNSKRQANINLFFDYVIVISFHEQRYPLTYYFR